MNGYIESRVLELADYLISNKSTVRETAKNFCVSKSTVHKDLVDRLPDIDTNMAAQAKEVLDVNRSERHIRGGKATRLQYLRKAKWKAGVSKAEE